MNVSEIHPSDETGSSTEGPAPDAAVPPASDMDRVLSLVDEVIGLKAELAAQQYRHDLTVWAMTERAAELETRTAVAEQRVDEILASRSWWLGQLVFAPADKIRRLRRRLSQSR
jgi:hypothetical protein